MNREPLARCNPIVTVMVVACETTSFFAV